MSPSSPSVSAASVKISSCQSQTKSNLRPKIKYVLTYDYLQCPSIESNDIHHEMFQTESGNYLKFGDKKVSGNIRNIQARPSSVPRLPSISQSRPSTNGLRKLQQHLESVQEDNEDEDCAS